MFTFLLLGILLVATSAGLVARAVVLPRTRALARLETISTYGQIRGHVDMLGDGRRGPLLSGLAQRLGGLVAARSGRLDLVPTRKALLAAGRYRLSPEAFLGYRLIAAPGLGVFWLATSGATPNGILTALLLTAGGWIAPRIILEQAASRRRDAIDSALPDLVDLLVVTVETGMSFGNSVQVAARRVDGPLADELRLVLQEQRMGLQLTDALSNMLERVDTPSMRSFVRSTVQGEAMGVSIGTIMRNIAVEMRKRRRARAEERANKAPVKMLFPLVFLIFPSLLVVLLGPSVIKMIDAFGSV